MIVTYHPAASAEVAEAAAWYAQEAGEFLAREFLVEKGLIAAMANNAGTGFCQFDGDGAAYAFTGAQYHGCLAYQLAGGYFAWDG